MVRITISFIPLIVTSYKIHSAGHCGFCNIKNTVYQKIYYDRSVHGRMYVYGNVRFIISGPGSKKQGRILMDEKHSNWEWTTQKFDTTKYRRKIELQLLLFI